MKLKIKRIKKNINIEKYNSRELILNEVYIGGLRSRWNPVLVGYLFKSKQGMFILNLEYSLLQIKRSLSIISNVIRNKGKILFTVLLNDFNFVTRKLLIKNKQGFIINKYSYGTLKRFRKMKRLYILKKLGKLVGHIKPTTYLKIRGYTPLRKRPSLVLITNGSATKSILWECKQIKIPTLSFVDSGLMSLLYSYPIVGNSKSLKIINMLMLLVNYTIFLSIRMETKNFIKNFLIKTQIKNKLNRVRKRYQESNKLAISLNLEDTNSLVNFAIYWLKSVQYLKINLGLKRNILLKDLKKRAKKKTKRRKISLLKLPPAQEKLYKKQQSLRSRWNHQRKFKLTTDSLKTLLSKFKVLYEFKKEEKSVKKVYQPVKVYTFKSISKILLKIYKKYNIRGNISFKRASKSKRLEIITRLHKLRKLQRKSK